MEDRSVTYMIRAVLLGRGAEILGPPVQTTEGDIPLLEAIAELKAMEPLEALESKGGMQRAAVDHLK